MVNLNSLYKNDKYQKHIERLQKACKRYQDLSEEEKDKRQKKAQGIYQSIIEERKEKMCQYYQECKQKLPGHRRNHYLTNKK